MFASEDREDEVLQQEVKKQHKFVVAAFQRFDQNEISPEGFIEELRGRSLQLSDGFVHRLKNAHIYGQTNCKLVDVMKNLRRPQPTHPQFNNGARAHDSHTAIRGYGRQNQRSEQEMPKFGRRRYEHETEDERRARMTQSESTAPGGEDEISIAFESEAFRARWWHELRDCLRAYLEERIPRAGLVQTLRTLGFDSLSHEQTSALIRCKREQPVPFSSLLRTFKYPPPNVPELASQPSSPAAPSSPIELEGRYCNKRTQSEAGRSLVKMKSDRNASEQLVSAGLQWAPDQQSGDLSAAPLGARRHYDAEAPRVWTALQWEKPGAESAPSPSCSRGQPPAPALDSGLCPSGRAGTYTHATRKHFDPNHLTDRQRLEQKHHQHRDQLLQLASPSRPHTQPTQTSSHTHGHHQQAREPLAPRQEPQSTQGHSRRANDPLLARFDRLMQK